MDLFVPVLLMVVGLALLVGGGEVLVRGASALAAAGGISPLVIGLTVVAFGTSAPELAVTLQSALADSTSLAIGNVVGSNIANILFILGLAALISPLVVSSQIVRIDVPLMIAASVVLYGLALMDGQIGRIDGAILFGSLLAYVAWTVRQSRKERPEVKEEYAQEYGKPSRAGIKRLALNLGLLIAGLALLVLGAHWLVDGAVTIARRLEVDELIIGLTIVAVGTSLPEVATSLVAVWKGENDIAVGNAVGSNLFNILCVLGLSSLVAPSGIKVDDAALRFDIPVMIAVAVASLPILFTDHKIDRWEGGLFLAFYLAYLTDVALGALGVGFARDFRVVMVAFVLPLTMVTLIIGVVRHLRRPRLEA